MRKVYGEIGIQVKSIFILILDQLNNIVNIIIN